MKPSGGRAPFSKSLALAIALHAALLAFIARQERAARVPAPPHSDTLLWFDLPAEPRALPPDVPVEPEAAEASGETPERTAALTPRESARALAPAPGGQEGAELEPSEPGAGDAPPSESATGERAPLTLEQLGIGDSKFFWNKEVPKPLSRHERVEKRLRQSLGTAIAQQDQKRGLGPEGPVVSRLESETRSGLAPPNSAALFRVVTDRNGRIVSLTLVSATSPRRHWDQIASRTFAALAATKLRNSAPNGVTFEIRVVSRVQLPSGAAPGFDAKVGGVPLTKGEGSRSTGIEILPPDGEAFETAIPPPSAGDPMNLPNLATKKGIGGQGDLADLGAVAQRMVHAFVERLWANEPPPEAPKPREPN